MSTPPPVLGRHHLVDRGIDRRILAADSHARDQPRRVEIHQPAAVMAGGEGGGPGAQQVQQEGHHQQPPPSQLIRQPAEDQRPDDLADQIDRGDQPDLG
jgi:hypothetical protein